MTLWTRLFGPSTTDRLIDLLREDRAAFQAQQAGTNALLTQLIDGVRAQSELASRQLDLLAVDTSAPAKVRIMTPAIEAEYEKERAPITKGTTVSTASILDGLKGDFASLSRSFDSPLQ